VKKILFSLFFILLLIQTVHAEESILISRSESMANIVFDGKWTSKSEWKESIQTHVSFGENKIVHVRTAHYENFIYFLLDFESDTTSNMNMDKATVCLNSDNNRNLSFDKNDFCFTAILNGTSYVSVGTANNTMDKYFENTIPFIGIGTTSDNNDRYSQTPHSSYEFKIPTELVGRSSTYGLYFSLYDFDQNQLYSWPNIETKNSSTIPSPNTWGTLISPDKSLPEFSFSIIFSIMLFFIAGIFILTKFNFFRTISY
jgi:hypothetical protein